MDPSLTKNEKKIRKILFRNSDGGPASIEFIDEENGLDVVKVSLTRDTCKDRQKICKDDYRGHCTDEGGKCCGSCVVCYEGWTGPNCQTPKGHLEMMSILWANTNAPFLPPDYSFMLYLEITFTE